jgi:hypothetical protein
VAVTIRRHRQPCAMLGVAVLIAIAATGCSGGSTKANTAQTPAPTGTGQPSPSSTGGAALFECLRQHGVTLPSTGQPSPGTGFTPPAGVDQDKLQAAFQACQRFAPGSGTRDSAFAAFASCLADHGVNTSGTGSAALQSLDRNDPAVKKAFTACRPLLPQGAPSNP